MAGLTMLDSPMRRGGVQLTGYTASGARRSGDEYQDLLSAEVLVEWLEHPAAVHWVRLETMEGSLDDVQVQLSDGTQRLLQVKFATDAAVAWEWDHLVKQDPGRTGPKPSLLQKWKASLDCVVESGVMVREAALRTNRAAGSSIGTHLLEDGLVDFHGLSPALQIDLASQLGGQASAAKFFASFHFVFKEPPPETLSVALERRFLRLGGTREGWSNLREGIRRWINHKDEPLPDGIITLGELRRVALWHVPPSVPQGFAVPDDYSAPRSWSYGTVEPRLREAGGSLLVVTGSPGSGKSTYLSWLVGQLREQNAPVVRHHYFLSITDETLRRTAWETAAESIIGQLLARYPELVAEVGSQNPTPERLRSYLVAAGLQRANKRPLVVIVDGLDHVWRDTGSEQELRLLFDLLLPVPDGVVIVVGTQNIDMARIPPKLLMLCPESQWLRVPMLERQAVREWLEHHDVELGLPEDEAHADRVLDELADAFLDSTAGHPLILHYSLSSVRQAHVVVRPSNVVALPDFDPHSGVATYYEALWQGIDPEGHSLLHLLAGFSWSWPRDGLIQCLAPGGDAVRLERAERAIRHVLGSSPAGMTAFHESLLAFVRARSGHEEAAESLRPLVLRWLTDSAPGYWRWRHEWELRAQMGDAEPLVAAATLDWCVDSLTDGRSRQDIANVVAASGWAALQRARLGEATERQYLDAYLDEAGRAESVLGRLIWLALNRMDTPSRERELDLFLSRKAQVCPEEIETAAEVAFSAGRPFACQELLRECGARWNSAAERSGSSRYDFESLEQSLPLLVAASLTDPEQGPYQRNAADRGDELAWCSRARYARALARLCVVGEDTSAVREELRFLATESEWASFEAVDEIVRLACREPLDLDAWIEGVEARRTGLFRCYRAWVQQSEEALKDAPREVSFQSVWSDRLIPDQTAFVQLAASYFFSCAAHVTEGRHPPEPSGVDARANKVVDLLHLVRDLAVDAAVAKNSGDVVGGAWLIGRLSGIDPPQVRPNDHGNGLARPGSVARLVVMVAQDLEELRIAETGEPSLTPEVVEAAVDGAWTWERVWIEERVERRLTMSVSSSARLLIDRENARLEGSRAYLHERAEHYASLAQFCELHGGRDDEVSGLTRLAARNLMGHGEHKDMVLSDVLASIRKAPGASPDDTLARLRSVSPVIQMISEITDGDETSHLKQELADIVGDYVPQALPAYVGALQHDHNHAVVEACFTDIARKALLGSGYEKALATTLVHESAMVELEKRANGGDVEAKSVLAGVLSYCGREALAPGASGNGSSPVRGNDHAKEPSIDDYPPSRLSDFVQAVRDSRTYGDEILASWTSHWRALDPGGLLSALEAYRAEHGYPLETRTAKAVVDLALERRGRKGAWDWLVAYHSAFFGWIWHAYPTRDVEWIWEYVRARFKDRWIEFIAETSRPRWGAAGGAPTWSVQRMIAFLTAVDEEGRVDEVLEAAVRWGAGLAADMCLPDPALTPGRGEWPVALRLLVDRLDCPSRMVQERAAWALARLLADSDNRDATRGALLEWHAADPLEVRSCILLLVLHLSLTAHGLSAATSLDIAREADVVPSMGARALLCEFGRDGARIADEMSCLSRHSGPPSDSFSRVKDFESIVSGHLAPVFNIWAAALNRAGIPFSRQWEWEASELARQQDLSLGLNAHFDYHYRGGLDGPALPISDRLSVVLRSAYLRALHSSIDDGTLEASRAETHARRIAIMADPTCWAVRPSPRPDWWPADSGETGGVDMLAGAVGAAVRRHLENQSPAEDETLLFAAGPVGNRPRLRAELVVRACLQAAEGSHRPSPADLGDTPLVECRPLPRRLSLSGTYATSDEAHGFVRDWLVAPLAWCLQPDTENWLLPERQTRGVWLPADWLFAEAPAIVPKRGELGIAVGDSQVARYRYWNDELRERCFLGASPRVGAELLMRRDMLTRHVGEGATLCWVVTLSIAERPEHGADFGDSQTIGSWVFGGSSIVRPEPWSPPVSPSVQVR